MSLGTLLEASLSQPMLNTRDWEEMEPGPSKEKLPGRSLLLFGEEEDEDSGCRSRLCLRTRVSGAMVGRHPQSGLKVGEIGSFTWKSWGSDC